MRHLRLLAILRKVGTIQGAATALGISQPAASRMVKEVEDAMGCRLFERQHRGVSPTAAGIRLLDKVGIVLEELGYTESEPDAANQHVKQFVRIGAISQVVTQILPEAIARLCTQDANLSVSLLDATSQHLLQLLKDGEIDCAIGGFILSDENKREFSAQELWDKDDRLCLIANRGNPALAKGKGIRKKISLFDTQSLRWVLPTQGTLLRNIFDAQFVGKGLIPVKPQIESPSPAVIHAFIAANASFCSISRESVLALLPKDSGIVGIELIEGMTLPRLQILTRRNPEKIRSLNMFLAALKSEIG
jgi:DNA-binding transcriptional LysR family regulator